jgi:hypothetical protein
MNKTLDFTASSLWGEEKNDQLRFFLFGTFFFGAGKIARISFSHVAEIVLTPENLFLN